MKIHIDSGHGGSDPGAVSHLRESQYTLSYGLELGRVLQTLGFEVNYSRTGDVDVSLSARCDMANRWGADYFISVHFNAGGGHGIETYALTTGGHAEKLGTLVQNALIDKTGSMNRGLKFANFQVLRDTSMSAILAELGFVDSDSDSLKIPSEEYRRQCMRGISKAICALTNTPWHDPYVPVVTPPVVIPVVVPAPIVLAPVIIAPVIIGKAIAIDDVYLSVRVREHLVNQAIIDIEKLGFSTQRLELA